VKFDLTHHFPSTLCEFRSFRRLNSRIPPFRSSIFHAQGRQRPNIQLEAFRPLSARKLHIRLAVILHSLTLAQAH
jgi:hypothetical protein